MSRYIEIEIQNLIKETGDTALAADRLIQSVEADPEQLHDRANIEAIAKFLLNSGFTATLRDFTLRNLPNENFPAPWPYFIEALALMNTELAESQLKALEKGIRELSLQKALGRSATGEKIIPEIKSWRSDLRYRTHKDFAENKKTLLDQLVTLRIQRLVEKEKELLQRLERLYPGDSDVKKEIIEHRQRYAVDILSRRSTGHRALVVPQDEPMDPQLIPSFEATMNSLKETAAANPTMSYELAVLAWVLEGYETGLEILEQAPEKDEQIMWLRLDFLLKNRRYLELLTELNQVELGYAHDPETFFATAYLRAQAYWGLGQKDTAIEIMESLLAARPAYRSGESLLTLWKGPQ